MALSDFCRVVNASSFIESALRPLLRVAIDEPGDARTAGVMERLLWLEAGAFAGYFDRDAVLDAINESVEVFERFDDFALRRLNVLPSRALTRLGVIRAVASGSATLPGNLTTSEAELLLLQSAVHLATQPMVDIDHVAAAADSVMYAHSNDDPITQSAFVQLFSFMEAVVHRLESGGGREAANRGKAIRVWGSTSKTTRSPSRTPRTVRGDVAIAFEWRLNCTSTFVRSRLSEIATTLADQTAVSTGHATLSETMRETLLQLIDRWQRAVSDNDPGPLVPILPPVPVNQPPSLRAY
jgi:hypothetical protein